VTQQRPNFDVFGQSEVEQNATFINSSMDITDSKKETPMTKKPKVKKNKDKFHENIEQIDTLVSKINKTKSFIK
jgi:uncharacterized FlaG/YvyC family protein